MPIYEYKCALCGELCEILQKVSDDPIVRCPHCKKDGLEKQVTAASFHLKGTGWYATDFKDKPKKSTDDKSSESSSDKKTEDKKTQSNPPETKTKSSSSED